MEGFGFFGAADAWWNQGTVLNSAWSQMVIDDLGITMWRNEYFPTPTTAAPQDAQWNLQKPVVQALYAAANASKAPLKTVLIQRTECSIQRTEGSFQATFLLIQRTEGSFQATFPRP